MFNQNESEEDKKIRLVIGAIALFLSLFVLSGTLQVIVFVVGLVAVITGLTGFCLIYKLLGIKTKKHK